MSPAKKKAAAAPEIPPIHQWTNGGADVLCVRCLEFDGSSHGSFRWLPDEIWSRVLRGEAWELDEPLVVECPDWNPNPVCGGGLHGWPWGIGVGVGRTPTPYALVFAADPTAVVQIDGDGDSKIKVRRARVVYVGHLADCMRYTAAGRVAWIEARSSGSASATGYSGSASATGERSVAAATMNFCTVEAGPGGIAAVTAPECYWRVHPQAVLNQRWRSGETEDGSAIYATAVIYGESLEAGAMVHVVRGEVVA